MFDLKESEEIGLIRSFRDGDGDAYSALLLKYEPLFASLIALNVCAELGSDEIRFVLEDAFRDSAMKYDLSDREHTFGVYAKASMQHRISNYRKSQRKHGYEQLDDNVSDDGNFETQMMREEVFVRICQKVKEICSPFEYRVFLSYLSGDTPIQTAILLHSDPKTVSNAKARALSKMRKNSAEFLI